MSSAILSKSFVKISLIDGFAEGTNAKTPQRLQIRPRQMRLRRLDVRASAGNSFGTLFRVATFGEWDGDVGCVIDGCPPRVFISKADLQVELDRRRLGQSRISRRETDTCEILSGLSEDQTTGTPIYVRVPNTDQRGHGSDRSSGRETIGRVAAGAVAKKILKQKAARTEICLHQSTSSWRERSSSPHESFTSKVLAYVSQVHKVALPDGTIDHDTLTQAKIESNIVRCPDSVYAGKMIDAIDAARIKGDSVGGVVTCIARNVPRGLGSPEFDKLEAELAKAVMSLPAAKGFEIGSGFQGTVCTGSEHNNEFYMNKGNIRTRTNRSGGIKGGISNGEMIVMRVAFQPTSTITKKQMTVTSGREETELQARGRHDPCVVPRAVPMVEAMVALVLVDQLMQQYARCVSFSVRM